MRSKPPQSKTNKILIGLLFSIFLISASSSLAQSLGEVAREEREKREEQSRRPRVYTNEDLSRPRILIRDEEQQESAAASAETENLSPSPSGMTSASEPKSPEPFNIIWPSDVPLGDVARFYRRQRELEIAREQRLEFTVRELPVLDLDFLLPSPLASPDFSDQLLAPPSIPEPVWTKAMMPQAADPVRVQAGDTLWKIAARHLGEGRDWRKIADANPELKNPNMIQAGQVLRLPGAAASSVDKTLRVQAGDSLWKVAASELGSGSAWRCLATANPQIEDANRIYPGQVLTIPTNCSRG